MNVTSVSATSVSANEVVPLNKDNVPLRTGPPTKEELLVHYPAKFTWEQMKTFVNSGDLGLLKRDRALQKRYDVWAEGIKREYGSMVNYLLDHRLRWGEPDTLSLLKSSLDVSRIFSTQGHEESGKEDRPYFTIRTPARYISIIQNDWPYSVPPEIEHTLIWTKVPIYHTELVENKVKARIEQDGLWGFAGNYSSPPSDLSSCMGALSEWGVTVDKMIKSDPPTAEEAILVEKAGSAVHQYIKNRWIEDEWETAWFVNPPRLQSVPGLAHIHVFARRK